ncbi:MAG: gliding motility-associated C-terminal domain-containing protein [Elusimicrobiota bacterium]|nr:gliding motility-associated C-terminal domain-containing protein [Elusimicrobiota bacterium]
MKAKRIAVNLMAALTLAPGAAFCASALGQSIVMNRLITPNGDGRNDTFIFRCHNPRDSAVEAKIYDLSGREIAVMRIKSIGTAAPYYYNYEWDPNSGSRKEGGVYVYQVRVETAVYKGTIVVIR